MAREKNSKPKEKDRKKPESIMIVYGDPSYRVEFSTLLAQWQARANFACVIAKDWQRGAATNEDMQGVLRSLLIFAGQVEQAVQDAAPKVFDSETRAILAQAVRGVDGCRCRCFRRGVIFSRSSGRAATHEPMPQRLVSR